MLRIPLIFKRLKTYGQGEFLRWVSDPYWFQGFSCVLGFDWHSSGTTTTTCGALKAALSPQDCSIAVTGGKGAVSRKTPGEIEQIGEIFSLSSDRKARLKYSSKMAAKVDTACIQDGYQLYHHCFFFTEIRNWAVVQQGMNMDFARRISLDLVKEDPEHLRKYFKPAKQKKLLDFENGFGLPRHHPVLDIDISKRGMEVLKKACELQPENYEELIALEGMGPKKIMALALISDLVYGSAPSFCDPVKYSFMHGGKDGYPYPVDREVYDNSIQTLRESLEYAKTVTSALRKLNWTHQILFQWCQEVNTFHFDEIFERKVNNIYS